MFVKRLALIKRFINELVIHKLFIKIIRRMVKLISRSMLLMLMLMLSMLVGCQKPAINCPPTYCETNKELAALEQLEMKGNVRARISVIRTQALRETALSVGARGGLAWRAREINCILLEHEKLLARVFNFNLMMLDKSVLPPVLLEARNTLKLTGTDVIRIADRNFQILSQARFVTAPPTWREYLWMHYTAPEIPDRSLLPRFSAERIVWKRYIDEGWLAGIQQANAIFRENVGRIKRDFEGMIRYKTLLAQNMVSPPFVAEMDMGVTGGCDDMTVNDRVLRITAFPCLQVDSRSWKTEIIPNE